MDDELIQKMNIIKGCALIFPLAFFIVIKFKLYKLIFGLAGWLLFN